MSVSPKRTRCLYANGNSTAVWQGNDLACHLLPHCAWLQEHHATTERIDRYERERLVERPAYPTVTPAASNVNVGPAGPSVATNNAVWAVTRIVTLLFTVLEVLLLLRFILKLAGANANQ